MRLSSREVTPMDDDCPPRKERKRPLTEPEWPSPTIGGIPTKELFERACEKLKDARMIQVYHRGRRIF